MIKGLEANKSLRKIKLGIIKIDNCKFTSAGLENFFSYLEKGTNLLEKIGLHSTRYDNFIREFVAKGGLRKMAEGNLKKTQKIINIFDLNESDSSIINDWIKQLENKG